MCKDKARVWKANRIGILGMEPAFIGVEEMDTTAGPLSPPNPSCLEKISALEVSGTNNLEMESVIKVEKVENGVNAISCSTSCSESIDDHKVQGLGPVTPFPNRENVELSSSSGQTEDEVLVLGCQTPTGSIFDPFAPGPEELAFAPKKKLVKESRIPPQRQLNFNSCIDSIRNSEMDVLDGALDEEYFLELICQSVLEVVVSNQFKEISGENLLAGLDTFENCNTPTSTPLLMGIAETCPAAPLRHSLKSRRLSPSICRKLQF